MTGTVAEIWRYPVKSLGGERLREAVVAPGRGLAHDRRYALVPADGAGSKPGWRPKSHCVALVRHAVLARVAAHYDAESGTLSLAAAKRTLGGGNPETDADRAALEAALNVAFAKDVGGRVALAAAGPGAMMSDVDAPYVSLVNLASVGTLAAAMAATLDPLRFRANFYLADAPAWCERVWCGKRLRVGDAVLEIVEPIGRCAATEVNPATAARDAAVLRGLADNFAHTEMGVYARVVASGTVAPGARLALES